MRKKELEIIYGEYAFEADESKANRKACMDTIFTIQNEEIQNGGRHIVYMRDSMECCCEAFLDSDEVNVELIKKTYNKDGEEVWYVECPFCKSRLVMTESSVKIKQKRSYKEERLMIKGRKDTRKDNNDTT
jgi:hypothetical protein